MVGRWFPVHPTLSDVYQRLQVRVLSRLQNVFGLVVIGIFAPGVFPSPGTILQVKHRG